VSTATTIGATTTARSFLYDTSGRVLGEYGAAAAMGEVKAEFIWLHPPAFAGAGHYCVVTYSVHLVN
jgi:hypothetical protein